MDKDHKAEEARKNMTIPQLIKFLKTAFLKRHFDEVQNILVLRDTQLNKKVQELIEENQLLSAKLDVEELQVAGLEDKLRKERQLRSVVEGERDALESELELWKMRFRELGIKEKLNKMSDKMKAETEPEDQTQLAPAAGEIKQEEVIWEDNNEAVPIATGCTIFDSCPITKLELNKLNAEAEVNTEAVPAGDGESDKGSTLGTKISNVDLIVIDESDDDCDFVGGLSGDKMTSEECIKSQRLELLNDVKGALALKRKRERFISSSTEDMSSSSDSDSHLEKSPSMIKPWKSEIEMFFALQKNDELVMKALCALYKQHTLSKKSVGMTRGFKDTYVHRGRALGAFLTNGDCEGKLSKSLWELCSYDPNALDVCKEIAFEHYSELFEIYKKNEYTFFP